MAKDYDRARDLLDRRLGDQDHKVRDASRTDPLVSALYHAAAQVIMDLIANDDGEVTRRILAPGDARDRVTRASRLLVHAAGGEVVVPFHLADIVDEIELDQHDEPARSRVVYRTRHAKGAAATVVDAKAAPRPQRIPHMEPGSEITGVVIDQ